MIDVVSHRSSAWSVAAFLLAVVGATAGAGAGCGTPSSGLTSSTTTTAATGGGTDCDTAVIMPGDDCAKLCEANGGVVIDNTCRGKCVDSACIANNICVNNACALQCTSYKDCFLGTQDCLPGTADSTGMPVFTCQSSNKAAFGTPCPFGSECSDMGLGACPNGDQCSLTQCGGGTCTLDPVSCIGVQDCTIGKCDVDGSACRTQSCSKDQCTPLVCISKGVGDADAYCSKQDCQDDSDCQSTFTCGVTSDPNPICAADPTMEKGGSAHCGATDAMMMNPMCIQPSDFNKNGATYFEGGICLLRKTCVERGQCYPCSNDAECANLAGGKCLQIGPDMRCTVPCATDTDCQTDTACTGGFCIPRYSGGCIGTGKFCEPCISDVDCSGGDVNSKVACVSNSTGQRACLDLAFSTTCTTDNDCPLSPGGKHGHCLGTNENIFPDGVSPGDSVYHTCYQVLDPIAGRFGCY